jgi:alkanesulfonate monooxygenase SsuD/methylene tetrahydromethanopterin reductase-like flavin-dependent oxidoreductase (luciferase family)
MQKPTPPVWMTGMSEGTGTLAAERGHVVGTLLSGGTAKPMYDAYRKRARELGWEAGPDRMAYAAVVGVGMTRDEGLRRADQIADYVRTAPVVAEPFTNPPGYNSIGANVAIMKAGPRAHRIVKDRQGNTIDHRKATVQQFMDTDTVFAGTPDDVFNQIRLFNDRMGGVGHLLFFGQGGFLNHQDAAENIRLFGREVAPRLAELTVSAARADAAAAE